jgi:hypothetical protein
MSKNVAAKTTSRDPLRTVADALDTAVKAAKDGAADAKATAGKMLPAAGRFVSRFVYTTSYTFSYGIVFPAVLIAKSIPANNAIVHGFVDGAHAASDTVMQMKTRRQKPPAALAQTRTSPAQTRTRATKSKRKTTR